MVVEDAIDPAGPGGLMQMETRRYHDVASFFCRAFLAKTIPHLVIGISGLPLRSPFASHPGEARRRRG
jgi:hypothetical protein